MSTLAGLSREPDRPCHHGLSDGVARRSATRSPALSRPRGLVRSSVRWAPLSRSLRRSDHLAGTIKASRHKLQALRAGRYRLRKPTGRFDHVCTRRQIHRALLRDCRHLTDEPPDSGVLNSGGEALPGTSRRTQAGRTRGRSSGLTEYVRGTASRSSEGLDALVQYNRLDLALETLILDESPTGTVGLASGRSSIRIEIRLCPGQVAKARSSGR